MPLHIKTKHMLPAFKQGRVEYIFHLKPKLPKCSTELSTPLEQGVCHIKNLMDIKGQQGQDIEIK